LGVVSRRYEIKLTK